MRLNIEIDLSEAQSTNNASTGENSAIELKNKTLAPEQSVQFSSRVILALKSKAKEYNSKNTEKVTLAQLKKVYVNGSGYSVNGKTSGELAIARVNMYLRMVAGESITKSAEVINKKEIKGSFEFDVTDSWNPSEQDYILAQDDVRKFDIDYNFDGDADLYIDEEAFGCAHIKHLL
jgi:hypothetical protein